MRGNRALSACRSLAALAAVLVIATPARAEDVAKKFRLGFSAGGFDTQSEVGSDAANSLVLLDSQGSLQDIILDPRNDSAALGSLTIKPELRADLRLSYAFNSFFVLEASVGYQKGDVGDVEMQVQFFGVDPPFNDDFAFDVYRIRAGSLTQIPVELSAYARFRPKAALSPYIGGGVGYHFIAFKSSPEFNRLSADLDASSGGFALLQGGQFVGETFGAPGAISDLSGASVDARDTFQWHLAGGVEYAFTRHWTGFVDFRYIFASRALGIRFNGEKDLGRSVPATVVDVNSGIGQAEYGAVVLVEGGLVDAGRLVPPANNPTANCTVSPSACDFVREPDGVNDLGTYYLKGGDIKYGGAALLLGVKYTF